MAGTGSVYKMEFNPIVLKQLLNDCAISQEELRAAVAAALSCDLSRTTINLVINRGYEPITLPGIRPAIQKVLEQNSKVFNWLNHRDLRITDIWQELGRDLRQAHPVDHAHRSRHKPTPAMVPGNPHDITIKEVVMVNPEALKHFKMFRNPFIDDIQKDADVFLSDDHRYIEAAMLDAAHHGGFLAVVAEVGAGKSVMRRKVIEQLKREGDVLVIYPQTVDKTRLNASSICDAIIQDISSEKCKVKLEDKSRQVQRLLLDRSKAGYRAVLIIEEAHDLNTQTLKYLKRFYELEDGYRKLLGIILIGQIELKERFDEGQNVDMREVIRRVQLAEIKGLNGSTRKYLELKFNRHGVNIDDVMTEDAFATLASRLTTTGRDGKSKVSHAYPLTVNNAIAKAMNLAYEMGETKITADVIEAM